MRHQVEFVLVGGVAAALRGAPVNTFDLDVTHSTDVSNVDRLLTALAELDAHYRHRPELHPDASHLSSGGHQLLMTRFGPLDVLGMIGKHRRYADLVPLSEPMELRPGLCPRVLTLDAQIAIKEEVGGEKDQAVLPLLRRVLEETRRRRH